MVKTVNTAPNSAKMMLQLIFTIYFSFKMFIKIIYFLKEISAGIYNNPENEALSNFFL